MPKRGTFLFLVSTWNVSLHFLGMFIEPFNQIHLYFVKSASLCSSWFFSAMIMSKTRTCWKNFQFHFHRISQGIVWLKWKSGLDRNCHAKRFWTIYIISNKFWLRYNKRFLNYKRNSWNLVLLSAIFSFYQIWIMSLSTNKHFFLDFGRNHSRRTGYCEKSPGACPGPVLFFENTFPSNIFSSSIS